MVANISWWNLDGSRYSLVDAGWLLSCPGPWHALEEQGRSNPNVLIAIRTKNGQRLPHAVLYGTVASRVGGPTGCYH